MNRKKGNLPENEYDEEFVLEAERQVQRHNAFAREIVIDTKPLSQGVSYYENADKFEEAWAHQKDWIDNSTSKNN